MDNQVHKLYIIFRGKRRIIIEDNIDTILSIDCIYINPLCANTSPVYKVEIMCDGKLFTISTFYDDDLTIPYITPSYTKYTKDDFIIE